MSLYVLVRIYEYDYYEDEAHNLKNKDGLKNGDHPRNEEELKIREDLKIKTN